MRTQSYWTLMILFFVFGCIEKNTENPNKAYKYWTGESPSQDVEVLNGKYWQSSHWTLEYIVYLELKTSPDWINTIIRKTKFKQTENPETFSFDKPEWFTPPENYMIFIPEGFSQGSTFFVSPDKKHLFIYDIQL